MPSSSKTSHLQLNKWLSSDKPKKDDFNDDNQKIDEACRLMSKDIEKLEEDQSNNSYADQQSVTDLSDSLSSLSETVTSLSGTVNTHTGNSTIHVTATDKTSWSNAATTVTTLSSTVSTHTGNSNIHVTAAEKTAWTAGSGFVTGYYTGNGNATQKVTLGYQPQFGVIFAAGYAVMRATWSASQLQAYCGFMSRNGCTDGIVLNSDGFTVDHISGNAVDGNAMKFNTSGVKFIYFIWK